jgi:hypothetical protein
VSDSPPGLAGHSVDALVVDDSYKASGRIVAEGVPIYLDGAQVGDLDVVQTVGGDIVGLPSSLTTEGEAALGKVFPYHSVKIILGGLELPTHVEAVTYREVPRPAVKGPTSGTYSASGTFSLDLGLAPAKRQWVRFCRAIDPVASYRAEARRKARNKRKAAARKARS